jgi:hypothetical protein
MNYTLIVRNPAALDRSARTCFTILFSKIVQNGTMQFKDKPVRSLLSAILVALICCLCIFTCQKTESVTLAVDFSRAATWRYLFGVDITGAVRSIDSTRAFSSSLRTYLSGEPSPHDVGAVRFKTSQTLLTSNFMAEQERTDLERRLENTVLYFSPREGAVEAVDTALPPIVTVGGWDLFRCFARVLPVLPGAKVRAGAVWDRERTFPVETSVGNATGWLYQSFRLDSIIEVDSMRCAWMSWRFSYRIEPEKNDSGAALDALPLRGTGKGSALIDITGRRMIRADAFFEVPAQPQAPLQASWQESVHIELVE